MTAVLPCADVRSGTTSHAPASSVSRGGLAALAVSTLIAVLVISVGQSDGSGEIAAELPASAESTSQTATSLDDTESSASSLLDDVDGAALFEAGARDEMPETTAAEATAEAAAVAGSADTAATASAADTASVPQADLPAPPSTIAAASATAGAQVAAPTTAAPAPTIVVPTTAAPTTAAPTTAAPTTAPPTTAAPTTAAPTTAAPTTEPAPPPTPSTSVPTDGGTPTLDQWAALRSCESGGRYTVISSNGLYHGAYQFAQSTWNGVARSAGRDDLVGVAPSAADPADQDAMALVLWTQRGSQPWPVCGRHLP